MKRLVQMWSAMVVFVGLVACGTDTPPLSTFNVSLNPESLSVAQGQSGTVSITIDKTNFTAPIDLGVQGANGAALPSGITSSFLANVTGGTLTV